MSVRKAMIPKELRHFGLLVGGVFCLIGLWPAVVRREGVRLWALILGALLVGLAIVIPERLGPIHRIWMFAGHILGWINTRIILAAIYYGMLTPIGLTMRLLGRDALRLKILREAETYRVPKRLRPRTHMLRQF